MDVKDTGAKDTKQRLNELQDLLQAEYITETEYRIARTNVLKEGGVDIVIHSRVPEEASRFVDEDEEDERKGGCGCGCFLMILFLLAAILIGMIFIAPDWTERFGGAHVRKGRIWMTDLWNGVGSLFREREPSVPVPDPVSSHDAISSSVPGASRSNGGTVVSASLLIPAIVPESAEPIAAPPRASEDRSVAPEAASSADAALAVPVSHPETTDPVLPEGSNPLPALNAELPALPEAVTTEAEPVTTVEIPAAGAVTSPVQQIPVEGTVRGFVSAQNVRIRSTPDTSNNDNVVGWGRNGDRFVVLGEGTGRDGSKWYNVRYEEGNKQGWISGSLITVE